MKITKNFVGKLIGEVADKIDAEYLGGGSQDLYNFRVGDRIIRVMAVLFQTTKLELTSYCCSRTIDLTDPHSFSKLADFINKAIDNVRNADLEIVFMPVTNVNMPMASPGGRFRARNRMYKKVRDGK